MGLPINRGFSTPFLPAYPSFRDQILDFPHQTAERLQEMNTERGDGGSRNCAGAEDGEDDAQGQGDVLQAAVALP